MIPYSDIDAANIPRQAPDLTELQIGNKQMPEHLTLLGWINSGNALLPKLTTLELYVVPEALSMTVGTPTH